MTADVGDEQERVQGGEGGEARLDWCTYLKSSSQYATGCCITCGAVAVADAALVANRSQINILGVAFEVVLIMRCPCM